MYDTSRSSAQADAIDLRSDTVTRPDEPMRDVMARADVGDDVYGDDASVNALEAYTADLLGKEAALYCTSGTQSNLMGVLATCQRGDEVIIGNGYHVSDYEARGSSVLGGVSIRTIPVAEDSGLDGQEITNAVRPDDFHFPTSRMLALENTHHGEVVSLARMAEAADAGRAAGLSVHLDGARFFNAVAELGCSPKDLAAPMDTISICLSKGLAAPVGSVLVGPEDIIQRARRYRKMLGGGMRQAGVIAAAGLYALENNRARLKEDHARARQFAEFLTNLGISDPAHPVRHATNMVFFTPKPEDHQAVQDFLYDQGIILKTRSATIRIVMHKDIDDAAFERACDGFRAYTRSKAA